MSGLVGRFRVLLPPPVFIVMYFGVYVLASVPLMLVGGPPIPQIDEKLRVPPIVVHFAGLAIYGIYRAAMFHPFFRQGYRQWLETTPWTLGKPLPVGPAHLVWEDVLIVAAMGLPLWLMGDVQPLASYTIALGAYLLVLGLTFSTTGAWGFQFIVSFGVGLGLRLWRERPEVYAAVILVTYVIGLIGLRRSLRHWPWADVVSIDVNHLEGPSKTSPLGWPFDRLGPRADTPARPRTAWGKLFTALLTGWWCYVLEHLTDDPMGQVVLGRITVLNLCLILISVRMSTTITGYAAPISLAGRITRLRPLIPSYDQIFVSPIAAAFLVTAGPSGLDYWGVPLDIAIPVCTALALTALWLGGPDRRTWQLIAKHRITPGLAAGSNKQGEFIQTG